jgi:hypothetical protein
MADTHILERRAARVGPVPVTGRVPVTSRPSYKAYRLLQFGFVVAPILAGADKFLHLLVNWDIYLATPVANLLPFSAHTFMLIVGVIEIAAGILVAAAPRIGAAVVSAWLMGIVINLLLPPGYYDIALRDFGLSLAACALWFLAKDYGRPIWNAPRD